MQDGAQEQQQGQGEVEHHGGDDPVQDGVVIIIENVKVGLRYVQHLQMLRSNVE